MRRNRRSQCLFGVVLSVVLATGLTVRAQTIPAPSPTPIATATPSLERQFFKNILHDQGAIWTAPFRLQRDDARWLVPAGIGTMALITTDRITGDEIAEIGNVQKGSRIVSSPGSIYGAAALAASFYLVGREKNDSRARETGILSAEASIDSLIVVSTLKTATQRVRPQTGSERSEFFDGGASFPSGHSAQAWTVATVIAHEYQDHRMVQVAAYGIASAVSIARFTSGRHYLSDAVVGSALGYGIGKYVYKTHHRNPAISADENREPKWPMISPAFNHGAHQYGVALTWSL